MPITAGSISVARRINTGDYSHKEAKAEIHFVADGEDAGTIAADASQLALLQVAMTLATQVKLNGTPEIELGAPPESVKSEQADVDLIGTPSAAQMQDILPKRHRRTKAEMAAARAEKPHEDTFDWGSSKISDEETPLDPATVSSEPSSETISDKELNLICNVVNDRIKNKPAIQEIIRQYTDGPVSTIPQEQRAEFLAKVKGL